MIVLILSSLLLQAGTIMEFTDVDGKRHSTSGRVSLIIIGPEHCPVRDRVAVEVKRLGESYSNLFPVVVIPCMESPVVADTLARSWRDGMGMAGVCVVTIESWRLSPLTDQWFSDGCPFPGTYLYDHSGNLVGRWTGGSPDRGNMGGPVVRCLATAEAGRTGLRMELSNGVPVMTWRSDLPWKPVRVGEYWKLFCE